MQRSCSSEEKWVSSTCIGSASSLDWSVWMRGLVNRLDPLERRRLLMRIAGSMNWSRGLTLSQQASSDCMSVFKPWQNSSFNVSSTRLPNESAKRPNSAVVFLLWRSASSCSPALLPPSECSNASLSHWIKSLKVVRFNPWLAHSNAFPVSSEHTREILLSLVGYNEGCWARNIEHCVRKPLHQRSWQMSSLCFSVFIQLVRFATWFN